MRVITMNIPRADAAEERGADDMEVSGEGEGGLDEDEEKQLFGWVFSGCHLLGLYPS